MNYVSVKVIESKTQGGARFVLKRMTERRRQALTEQQAGAVKKMSPLMEEYLPLSAAYRAAIDKSRAIGAVERRAAVAAGSTEAEALALHPHGKIDFADEKFRRWAELRDLIGKIEREEMETIALRFVVVRLEEFEVDGLPVTTIDELDGCDGAPDEFRAEVLMEVKREVGLLPAEVENLSSPSTSAAAVDGASPSGSADRAGITETTTVADAASSTGPASADVLSIDATR